MKQQNIENLMDTDMMFVLCPSVEDQNEIPVGPLFGCLNMTSLQLQYNEDLNIKLSVPHRSVFYPSSYRLESGLSYFLLVSSLGSWGSF